MNVRRYIQWVACVWFFAACAPTSTPTVLPSLIPAPTATRTLARELATPPAPILFHRQSDIANLAADDSNVYWSTCDPKSTRDVVAKIAKPSGVVTILAPDQQCPSSLTLNASNLYWISGRKVMRVGQEAATPAILTTLEGVSAGLVVDQSDVYVGMCDSGGGGAVLQISKSSGALKTIASDARCPRVVGVDAANVYYIGYDRTAGHELLRVGKSGGNAEKIATLARHPVVVGNVVMDERAVYWMTRQDPSKPQGDADDYNSILALDLQTKAMRAIANQQPRPSALALDASNVYWSNCGTLRYNFENTALMRSPQAPSTVPLVPFVPSVCSTAIAVDAANIYWVTKDGIMRAPTNTPTRTSVPPTPTPPPTTSSGGSPTIAGCPIFPPDNAWNRDISNDPIDPNSAAYIARISQNAQYLHADFGSPREYGIPFVVVTGAQPKVPITFTEYGDESDPGPYPVPANAPVEYGDDHHVLVLNSGECKLYEMYHAQKDPNGAGWFAGSGAVFDLRSNSLRPQYWTSADAAGLPILPGLVRYDEVVAGEIRHAVRFTAYRTQRAFVHPATHYASSITDASYPPMGLRVRLKASYDTARFYGQARVILNALKKYGMILADNGTSWFITGATDPRWNDADLDQLKTVPGSAFEVVQLGTVYR